MENLSTANFKDIILIAAGIYPPDVGGPATHAKAQFEGFPKYQFNVRLAIFSRFLNWPKGIRHLLYLIELLRKGFRSSVIYAHDALGTGFPALIVAKILRKKYVVRVGGDIVWERALEKEREMSSIGEWYEKGNYKNDTLYQLTRWVLRRADLIIVPSGLLANLYINYYGVESNKVAVIANPIPSFPTIGYKKERTIIFASRLVIYKNLALVLRVLTRIFDEYPDTKFIIMGDGPERKNLEGLAQQLNITENIIFTGKIKQDEVIEKTSSCLFALAPALTEFNPNYILQCLAFGKPFIISKENGLPFNVPEELIFDPRDGAELYERLLHLLNEDGYKKASELVEAINFTMTWDENLRLNIELISKILESQE
jgi:glycosyltransferase involved in cell wall biosynthesis